MPSTVEAEPEWLVGRHFRVSDCISSAVVLCSLARGQRRPRDLGSEGTAAPVPAPSMSPLACPSHPRPSHVASGPVTWSRFGHVDGHVDAFTIGKRSALSSASPRQAASSEDMGRWIGILLAETGSSADPGALHYDYIDVDLSASVIQTAKQAFW